MMPTSRSFRLSTGGLRTRTRNITVYNHADEPIVLATGKARRRTSSSTYHRRLGDRRLATKVRPGRSVDASDCELPI
jgi:hypothetical protein